MGIKVCHISTVHFYNDDRILYKQCCSLAQAGYEVFFVVPHTKREKVMGVEVVPLKRTSSRFYRVFVLSFVAMGKALGTGSAIFHFHDPELMGIGVLLKLMGKKVIYDVHEDLPKQLLYKRWISSELIKKSLSSFIKGLEQFCCLFYNRIMPATPDIAAKFSKKKTVLIRNLAILKLIDRVQPAAVNSEKIKLIYVGGFSDIRGIKETIRALEILNGKAELWLLGAWATEAYEKACKEMEGYKYVTHFGMFPLEEVYPYIKKADIGMALLYPAKNYITSLPVKSFEYMACEKPMIMSDFVYWKEVFKGCALFIDPMNPIMIVEAVLKLDSDKQLAADLAKRGRELLLQEYSWEAESVKLINAYNTLTGGN
jgi:glycosyltransferase involved in cell wall biosynthesis